jgi:hypothetical protein
VRCGHPFPSCVLTPDLPPAGPHRTAPNPG